MDENINPIGQINPPKKNIVSMVAGFVKKNLKLIIMVIVVIIAAAIAVYFVFFGCAQDKPKDILSAQDAAQKALTYINNEILKGQATAILKGVSEANGVYKITLNISGQEGDSYVTKNGKLLFPGGYEIIASSQPVQPQGSTIGDFSVTNEAICKENNKPIIYFFGSKSCPHCVWEKPIFEAVAAKFREEISLHQNIDSDDDSEIFSKYSTGGIPLLVLGCKYYRLGSGEQAGEETETKNLTALVCKLTGGKPGNVCSEVQDLINQIEN